jgi:hypothetical protein
MSITLGDAVLYLRSKDAGLDKGLSDAEKKSKATFANLQKNATSFLSGVGIAAGVVTAVGAAIKKVTDQSMEYALAVGDLSSATGATAEEMSSMIQVVDNLRISNQTLTMSLRTMANNGINPTMESLMKLSDQYLKLPPGAERAKFAMDNFGRSGLEMTRVMEAGRGKMGAMAAEAKKLGLVIGDEVVEAAKKLHDELDLLGDQQDAISLQVGTTVIPVYTSFLGLLNLVLSTARESGWTLRFLGDLLGGLAARGREILTTGGAFKSLEDRMREAQRAARGLAEEIGSLSAAEALTALVTASLAGESREATDALWAQYQAALAVEGQQKKLADALKKATDRSYNYIINYIVSGQAPTWGGAPVPQPNQGSGQSGLGPRVEGPGGKWFRMNYDTGRYVPAKRGFEGIVPSGFPNDSFRFGATSGEEVVVKTKEQQREGGGGDTFIYNLTAHYAHQSERSLRDDIRVLELLRG